MTDRYCVTVAAPAKINLGLEVLGTRADGFHEIRTVLAMLDLADDVRIAIGTSRNGADLPGLPAGANIIARALDAFGAVVPNAPPFQWSVVKRIPSAAGLGGASADAAAALIGANDLAGSPMRTSALGHVAASLGSDIPFFLGSPVALASGRGTELEPLPAVSFPVALMVPRVSIPDKTRTLYGMLTDADVTDGSQIDTTRAIIAKGDLPGAKELRNAFSRPLARLVPEVEMLRRGIQELGIREFGQSGAGPAHYVIGTRAVEALACSSLPDRWRETVEVIWTHTRSTPLRVAYSRNA